VIEILAFGEVNPDIIVTGVPDLTFGQREDIIDMTTMTVGSSAAILSCGAARLGARIGLVGVVGDDAFGTFMQGRLAERHVDTSQVRVVPGGRTGSSVIVVRRDDPNDRHIFTDLGVMGELRATDVVLDDLPHLKHLHIGSWFLQRGALDGLPDLLGSARARGVTTSVDPNDDPERTWDSGLHEALRQVDLLFCNEDEAVGLAGGSVAPLAAAARLLATMPAGGASAVILKCGGSGAYALTSKGTLHVSAPSMGVVDTVGAGDSLAAGYLTAWTQGVSVESALCLGVAAGSLSTRRSGGVDGQATLEEASALAAQLTVEEIVACH
jgi:ribokinase